MTRIGVAFGLGATLAMGCAVSAQAAPTAIVNQTWKYSGAPQEYRVPDGVSSLTVDAVGGSGGTQALFEWGGGGAEVEGTLPVTPGELLRISVGGNGSAADRGKHDSPGGWGGMGANGGSGNGASDTLRSSSSGGGATTLEAQNADGSWSTILVAGGGGGVGGGSGNPGGRGRGGNAGWSKPSGDGTCYSSQSPDYAPSWAGSNVADSHTANPFGGNGGTAGSMSGMAGGRGQGGRQLGGNGGGGGGGVSGGAGGGGAGGTSAGAGGGAGSSASYLLDNPTVDHHLYRMGNGDLSICAPRSGHGFVTLTSAS